MKPQQDLIRKSCSGVLFSDHIFWLLGMFSFDLPILRMDLRMEIIRSEMQLSNAFTSDFKPKGFLGWGLSYRLRKNE